MSGSGHEEYVANLASRLSKATFTVQTDLTLDLRPIEILAVRPSIRIGGFRDAVMVTRMGSPTVESIQEFSSFAMKYCVDHKNELGFGSGDNLNVFSIVISDNFSDDVKKNIGEKRPGGSSIHGRVEFPILAAMGEHQTHFYNKTPIRAGLRYRILRDFAKKSLSFEG